MRTQEQFMSEIDAILARYISGGFEAGSPQHGEALEFLNAPRTCPGCRVTLDNKLICPCNPELEATHGRDEETHS